MKALCAVVALAGLAIPSLCNAGPFSLSGENRWVVYASRKTQADAVREAEQLSWKSFTGLRVMQAANGWFAVVKGPYRIADPRTAKDALVKQGAAPDLIFSRGELYQNEVWRKFDGKHPISMRVGDTTITVS